MLKGISPLIGPELLKILHEMGHGDRLLLADAHFPGHAMGRQVVRADGVLIAPLLAGILPLVHLEDRSAPPLTMMAVEAGDVVDRAIEEEYVAAAERFQPGLPAPVRLGRAEFYEAARGCFAVVMTGDTRPYGNVLLTKGVTPC